MSNRRDFIRLAGSFLGASMIGTRDTNASGDQRAVRAAAPEQPFAAPPLDEVRIGYVGVGLQGTSHVENLLNVPGARIAALCDIVEEKVRRAQKMVTDKGHPEPAAYVRGP